MEFWSGLEILLVFAAVCCSVERKVLLLGVQIILFSLEPD